MTTQEYDGWEIIRQLGAGGQGDVYLARSPQAKINRASILGASAEALLSLRRDNPRPDVVMAQILDAAKDWASQDGPADLGALKVFRLPAGPDSKKPLQRLESEIAALQRFQGEPGLLKILHSNPEKRILVTTYHASGALSAQIERYKGNPVAALEAIRPVVAALSKLHAERTVHRDIKPENIFVADDDRLVLGDFGIVFFDDLAKTRISDTYENVGSRDWMPGWAYGMSLDDVTPAFDVFGLGKTIWAMVAGKTKLRLWYFRDEPFDLERLFPESRCDMQAVNALLDKCVVEREKDCRLPTAAELLVEIERVIAHIRGRSQILSGNIDRRCQVCGMGTYRPALKRDDRSGDRLLVAPPVELRGGKIDPVQLLNFRGNEAGFHTAIYFCDQCGHAQVFWLPDDQRLPAWT